MAPASLAASAVKTFQSQDKGLINHFLIVEGEETAVDIRERQFSLPDPFSAEARSWHALGLDPESSIEDVEVEIFGGEKRHLSELVGEGETLILNLWATWCRPCAREMPELEQLHQRAGSLLRVVGLNIEPDIQDERIGAFLADLGVTYPVARIKPVALDRLLGTTDPGIPISLVLDDQLRPRELLIGWSEDTSTRLESLASAD